ncbi:Tripeptidyl-peptidase 2 [Camellia lanceoleosa]|uniref:Tripeptidyl-peptidase 2 n=1 Tax=Camellia lanceoleosa TaxID=1840588 RepID=A0ACC0IXR2_9ERIC|nr:Tripeptidyl-peptidase 2 [Camellia lanceoleosa]
MTGDHRQITSALPLHLVDVLTVADGPQTFPDASGMYMKNTPPLSSNNINSQGNLLQASGAQLIGRAAASPSGATAATPFDSATASPLPYANSPRSGTNMMNTPSPQQQSKQQQQQQRQKMMQLPQHQQQLLAQQQQFRQASLPGLGQNQLAQLQDLQGQAQQKFQTLHGQHQMQFSQTLGAQQFQDGPVMGNGSFKSSVLVPGVKEAFYVGPPTKDKLPKNSPEGSCHQLSLMKTREKVVPRLAQKVSEWLEEEVRDAKIKVLASLKQGTVEECLEWKKLSSSLKSEYPKYTPLLAKILEGLLSQNNVEDKIPHLEEIIDAADEVIGSVDTEELAKYFSFKSDPEDEGAEKMKKKMETACDQLAEALYQKGLAMAEIESMKGEEALALASTEGANVLDRTNDKSVPESNTLPDLFEENIKELKKWVDVKSSKYATLLVIRERRCGRLGTALKALNDMIQVDGEALKKKLYELKLLLLDQIGWGHWVSYERQ